MLLIWLMELMDLFRAFIYGLLIFLGIFYNGFIGTHLIFAVGAIFGFLIFNLGIIGKKRWVFLGDHGSNLLGFLVAIALIAGSQESKLWPKTGYCFMACCNTAFLIVLGLIIKRLNRGVGPFDADRDHFITGLWIEDIAQKIRLLIIISIASIVSLFGVIIEKYVEYISFNIIWIFAGLFYYLSIY